MVSPIATTIDEVLPYTAENHCPVIGLDYYERTNLIKG